MFEQVNSPEPRAPFDDWLLRGGIVFVFVSAAIERTGRDARRQGIRQHLFQPGGAASSCAVAEDKYSPDWVRLFPEIGPGQWFRYLTGVVEIPGEILVLIPWAVTAGLALLGCTMASAALIMISVVGRSADSVFSVALFIALSLFWWSGRNR